MLFFCACGATVSNNVAVSSPASQGSSVPAPTPQATPGIPNDGNYFGRGKVTKINAPGGSIEIDHEEIPGMMPAMKMEFNVKDKALLDGLAVGDDVKFVIEYKHPGETITAIKKMPK